jgi:MFS family permease
VLTLVTPIAAHNSSALIFVRVLEGLIEAVTFPAMFAIWSRWAPPKEKTFLTTFAQSGHLSRNMFPDDDDSWTIQAATLAP